MIETHVPSKHMLPWFQSFSKFPLKEMFVEVWLKMSCQNTP